MPSSILYIEDGPDDVLFLQRALRKAAPQAQLHVISDGQQAMDYFDPAAQPDTVATAPDLVLLDLNLPGRSGLEVLRHIRKNSRTPAIPVLMFSASNQQKDVDACYAEGCSAYLIKPSDSEGLRQLVNLIVDFWLKENFGTKHPPGLRPSS